MSQKESDVKMKDEDVLKRKYFQNFFLKEEFSIFIGIILLEKGKELLYFKQGSYTKQLINNSKTKKKNKRKKTSPKIRVDEVAKYKKK